MERATSTCGPQGMEAPTTIVTVTDMPPVCGLSPLILPPTTDRRPDMTNPAPLLSPPRSVTAKALWEMPGWYVRPLISLTAKFPVLYWLSISIILFIWVLLLDLWFLSSGNDRFVQQLYHNSLRYISSCTGSRRGVRSGAGGQVSLNQGADKKATVSAICM